MSSSEMLSVTEFAAELGLSRITVGKYVRNGLIPEARRMGPKVYRIPREALARFNRPAAPALSEEDADAEFVREVVAAAGQLTPEARASIRRLLPVSESVVDARGVA